jgi:glucokinase
VIDNSSASVIGVDIGGSKVLAGTVAATGAVGGRVRLEGTIVAAVEQLAEGAPPAGVGVGAAGFVDAPGETVLFAPHLSWRNEPLRDALAKRLGVPVLLDNDANTTAWAEHRFGAARAADNVLCLTLGTGIGGALIVNGGLFRGGHGLAGEFGHMTVVRDGRRCECGNRGCWEQYASGNVLVREARELVQSRSPAAHQLRELVEDDPGRLTGPTVTAAAAGGDLAAVELFTEIGSWLGTGLAGLVAAFDPELIVVGGGLSDAGDLLLDPARETLARSLTGRGFRPVPAVVAAELGPDAGFIGAADLARLRLL